MECAGSKWGRHRKDKIENLIKTTSEHLVKLVGANGTTTTATRRSNRGRNGRAKSRRGEVEAAARLECSKKRGFGESMLGGREKGKEEWR